MQKLIKEISARRIIPLVLFDIIWFLAVWGRDTYVLINSVMVLLLFMLNRSRLLAQAKPLALFIAVGLVSELSIVLLGVISFTQTSLFLPFWLVVLWFGFAATAFTSMDWLAGRYGLAGLLGLVFGPITYLAGVGFGAAFIQVNELVMISTYAVTWSVLMMLLARLVTFYRTQPLTEQHHV